jgi:hypothetical protein
MTATNHAVAGAVVAAVIKQPALVIPLAFVSHFVMDAVPHFKVRGRVLNPSKRKLFWAVNISDVLVVAALFLILPHYLHPLVAPWLTILCMTAAISPDLPWIYYLRQEMRSGKTPTGNYFTRFHLWVQWKEVEWAAAVETVWLVSLVIILMHLR